MAVIEVEFSDQQLQLVDRVAREWSVTRGAAIASAVGAFLGQPKTSKEASVPDASDPEAFVGRRLETGSTRFEQTLQPVSGKALPVQRGEVLRIGQVEGEQCVDFNAFNLHDYKEHMSVGHSRQAGLHLSEGDVLISNPPRYRPMLFISSMPSSCVTDTLGARCHAILFEQLLGFGSHTNCQDTFAEALREFDLTPDDVHDSFNMFMNTHWDDRGSWWIEWNTGKRSDSVDLLACMDTLCVPIVCGSGDVALTSNFSLKPIRVSIFESTNETLDQVRRIEDRFAAPLSRKTLADYQVKAIRTERSLSPNPEYKANYRILNRESISIPVDPLLLDQLEGLSEVGFAIDPADAVRRVFMMWFLATHSGPLGKRNFPGNKGLISLPAPSRATQ